MAKDNDARTSTDSRVRDELVGRNGRDGLIPKHGGYRNLKTFRLAEAIYDITVRFCGKYVDRRSRTVDQMVQAARSGRQNIAEGSVDSATSKKMELKLTGVAKGSLEELRLDYEDYLRQLGYPQWKPDHPALLRFKARRCASLAEFRLWVADEVKRAKDGRDNGTRTDDNGTRTDDNGTRTDDNGTRTDDNGTRTDTDAHGRTLGDGRTNLDVRDVRDVRDSPCPSVRRYPSVCPSVFVANGALSLLNLCVYLLDRQLKAQAEAFEKNGGFTERLYRRRRQARG